MQKFRSTFHLLGSEGNEVALDGGGESEVMVSLATRPCYTLGLTSSNARVLIRCRTRIEIEIDRDYVMRQCPYTGLVFILRSKKDGPSCLFFFKKKYKPQVQISLVRFDEGE